MRNIFTGLVFASSSNETLLPVGAGKPEVNLYLAKFGHINVGTPRGNAGNRVVADFRRKEKALSYKA